MSAAALQLRPVRLLALLATIAVIAALGAEAAPAAVSDYGIESVGASRSTSQAGGHPDFTTVVTIETDPASAPDPDGDKAPFATTRDLTISLPPGMTGNPNAVAECTAIQFATGLEAGGCPLDSQVGVTVLHLAGLPVTLTEPVFRLQAPGGDDVARLGFYGYAVPVVIDVQLRPETDYGLTAAGKGFYTGFPLVSAETTLWGVPADPVHDTKRLTIKEVGDNPGISSSPPRSSGLSPLAFLNNPSSCGGPLQVDFTASSYQSPSQTSTGSAQMPATVDCGPLEFGADIDLQPTSSEADSPSGMDVTLSVDQANISQPNGLAPAHLKRAVVTLPEGMSLNPAAADGLGGCSEAAVGLISRSPIRFDSSPASCPDSSKVGTALIETPVLDGPIEGALYVARPDENPFGSLLAGYLVAHGQGATVKLAGRFDLDPLSGRITATFDNNPQQPFSAVRLHFKGGSRGVLVMPPRCGRYEIDSALVPWSAIDPEHPAPSETVHDSSFFDVLSGPGGGPCPNPPGFSPSFAAGTQVPLAGIYSPFLATASRPDGSQVLSGIEIALPPGLTGKLAGIPYCPDAALAAAAARKGTAELAAPSCPAAARIGGAVAGAGAGSTPFHVPGSLYLAGPYRGAPLSVAAITPALAGPFDLGTVVVRAALRVDPETAQVTAVSDPLPTILRGVPLHLRSVAVSADRDGFTLNPTSCDPMAVRGVLSGPAAAAALSSRFQVGGCRGLDFEPRLSLRLSGGTRRNAHPALRATLTMPEGGANVARAQVALPHSEFLDQSHIRTICTRVQFAADACPAGAVYGRARAFTPLLDQPLEGPVYLRSSNHELPDLVADLRGQVGIVLAGRIDSIDGGIRTTFENLPDAPVSRFVFSMQGGGKGLLINSRDLCAGPATRATAKLDGQNGKVHDFRPPLRRRCGQGSKRR